MSLAMPRWLILLMSALGALMCEPVNARSGGGFPCDAETEWVVLGWRSPQPAECRSCFECDAGQVCHQRGGCFNCTPGEYDDDGDPTSACVACPDGKTSRLAAGPEGCREADMEWWDSVINVWTELDTTLQLIIGVPLSAIAAACGLWVCQGCEGGIGGLCDEVKDALCGESKAARINARAVERAARIQHGQSVPPDEENPGETNALLNSAATLSDADRAQKSRCPRFCCCRREYSEVGSGDMDAQTLEPSGALAALVRQNTRVHSEPVARDSEYSARHKLRQDLTDWALCEHAREIGCIIVGGPGVGKTTMMSELVRNETEKFHDTVLASHFCDADNSESLKASEFVRGVVTQLYKACRPYRDAVDKSDSLVEKVSNVMKGAGPTRKPSESFMELVLDVLAKELPGSARPKCGCVLAIDSLDEALLFEGEAIDTRPESIVNLLHVCSSKRPRRFPQWFKVLATSRDVPEVSRLTTWRRVDLDAEERLEENREAVRTYINIRLHAPGARLLDCVNEMGRLQGQESKIEQPELNQELQHANQQPFDCPAVAHPYFEKLVDRSRGNFLYVETALNDMEARNFSLAEITTLPAGLDELFSYSFERLFRGAQHELYAQVRVVFEAILASEGGVTVPALIECMRLRRPAATDQQLKATLQGVRQFLKPAPARRVLPVPAPTCDRGHAMIVRSNDRMHGWRCKLCGSKIEFSKCGSGCQYFLCKDCSGPLCDDFVQPEVTDHDDSLERLMFYHLSFREWLQRPHTGHDYQCDVSAGNQLLGIVHCMALVGSPFAERMVRLTSEQLRCMPALEPMALRKAAFSQLQIDATVWSLAHHLGAVLDDYEADIAQFGALIAEAGISGDAKVYDQPDWVDVRCICVAAAKGENATVALLLTMGAAAHATSGDRFGYSPVHWAAKHNQSAALYILHQLAPSSVHDKNVTAGGWTAVHVAATFGQVHALQTLLKFGLNVNVPDGTRKYPLHCAAESGHVDALRLLLSEEVGAEVEAKAYDGETALHCATLNSHVKAMHLLLSVEVGAEVEAQGRYNRTPLHYAAREGHVDALRLLLSDEAGAEVEAEDGNRWTALHCAAFGGHVDALRLLLSDEVGAEAEAKDCIGWTALHCATFGGHVDALRLLLSNEVDVNVEAKSSEAHRPFYGESADELRWLVGTDYALTALHLAAHGGHVDALRLLLSDEVRAEVKAKTGNGLTALHLALQGGQVDALRLLLSDEFGVELEAKDSHGRTALHYAARKGQVDALRLLLSDEVGAEVEAKDSIGFTALHYAAHGGHVQTLRLLLSDEVGAEAEAKDSNGLTALHVAERRGHVDALRLLRNDAKISIE